MATRSAWLAFGFFFVLLPLIPACGGGGCGEDSSKSSGSPDQSSAGMASPSTGGGGSAELKGSRFDTSSGKSSSTALGNLGEVSGQLGASASKVSEEDFKARVLKPGTTVFLTVVRADCPDCAAAAPVLKALEPEFKGKFDFVQVDGNAVGIGGLLPKAMTLEPLPAFAMYKDGKVTSTQQGLPFPRGVDASGNPFEPLPDYQARLMRWFHDALTQKDLNFARGMRRAPAPKD